MRNDLARWLSKVDKTEAGCWEWQGAKDRDGYGVCTLNGKPARAHRAALMLHGQTIPDGMVVDHQCRNRACVNPEHLRIVDRRTNVLENSESHSSANAIKTNCPRGHEYAGENLILRRDRRYCRECERQRNQAAWGAKWKAVRQARALAKKGSGK